MKIDSTDKIISNLFNKLGPVNAFSDVLPEINALVGACIIGNFIGVSALGAMSYIALLNNIISAFSSLLGTGSLILCSRYLGAGDKSGMNKTFNTTLLVSITLGTVIAFMCFAFPAKLALGLRAPSEMVTMVSDYITGYSGYCLFVVFHLVLLRFLQIDGAAFLSSVCIFVQLSLNILLNVLNVTVFRKGMIGVGLAASISTGVSVVIEVAYFLCRGKLLHFSFKDFSFSVCKETCTLGFNESILNIYKFLRNSFLNSVIFAIGGSLALSAQTVANQVTNVFMHYIRGINSGCSNVITGMLIGEKNIKSLRRYPKLVLKKLFPLALADYLLIFIFARRLALMFGVEEQNIDIFIFAIRLVNLWGITNILRIVGISIYSSLKKIKLVAVFNFFGRYVFQVLWLLIAKNQKSLFLGYLCSTFEDISFILMFIVYVSFKQKKLCNSLTDLVCIDSLQVDDEDCYSACIESKEDAVSVSQDIISFCRSKGMSAKNSFFCGLCIEEICMDTITHGFDGKVNSIDINVTYQENKMTVNIRDFCKHFNPEEWLKLYAEDDPQRSLGLKMVSKLAEEMTYTNKLGMNTVMLRI